MNCPLCNRMPVRSQRTVIGDGKPMIKYGEPIPVLRVPFGGGTLEVYICSGCGLAYGNLKKLRG